MVLTIADILLRIAKQKNKKLTPMQLMKLTYIANGWSLAIKEKPLFKNSIEAWKYGPVMPDLYHATKSFGRDPIPFEKIKGDLTDLPEELKDEVEFLKKVYSLYEDKSGIALSSLTHMHGTPWHQTFNEYEMSKEIPVPLIKAHYDEQLVSRK
jgi:uncharacterized phage-associated protein